MRLAGSFCSPQTSILDAMGAYSCKEEGREGSEGDGKERRKGKRERERGWIGLTNPIYAATGL